jgi:hypothetical protein
MGRMQIVFTKDNEDTLRNNLHKKGDISLHVNKAVTEYFTNHPEKKKS